MLGNFSTLTIDVGGKQEVVALNTRLTAAEFVAADQVLTGGSQSLKINAIGEAAGGNRLVAPIPGQVTAVQAKAGDAVTRGQVLVILEAMKTVFRLAAPADGVVAAVSCAAGETVQEGQVLVSFAEPDAA